jgi:hypothetical protein
VQYKVPVLDASGNSTFAVLEEAQEFDMSVFKAENGRCDWESFWRYADFNCEAIIKITYQQTILGLIRFGLYPYPTDEKPEFIYVSHVECVEKETRLIKPVGFWLFWYATRIALDFCSGDRSGTILFLDSVEDAIDYYRDKVMMEGIGWVSSAPGEDYYAFGFTKEQGEAFCNRVEGKYGSAVPITE